MEVINRDLLLSAIVFGYFYFFVLVTVYQPMMEMKRVGVQKVFGFQSKDFVAGFVKTNFYSFLGGSLVIDLGPFLVLDL